MQNPHLFKSSLWYYDVASISAWRITSDVIDIWISAVFQFNCDVKYIPKEPFPGKFEFGVDDCHKIKANSIKIETKKNDRLW